MPILYKAALNVTFKTGFGIAVQGHFFDSIHPTATGRQIIAAAANATLQPLA